MPTQSNTCYRSKRIRLPLFLFCYAAAALLIYSNSTLTFLSRLINHNPINNTTTTNHTLWTPQTYLALALAGPRRCHQAPCYILDVLPDPHQPRLFLLMLGLPASDIPRPLRGNVTHVNMMDIRTGQVLRMVQSSSLVNDTHGFALLLTTSTSSHMSVRHILVSCHVLPHHGGTARNAQSESMTYACDMPPHAPWDEITKTTNVVPLRVDVLLAPRNLAATWGMGIDTSSYWNLNGPYRPFYIFGGEEDGEIRTSGLWNSVSRRRRRGGRGVRNEAWDRGPQPPRGDRGTNTTRIPPWVVNEEDNTTTSKRIPKASVCLIGVDYASSQHREIIQYYLTIGFQHVYLGLPLWPTSSLFHETWQHLQDFVYDGTLSIVVSEYAASYIEPERFGRNFTYAPQGHKSSFANTCLLGVRMAGDDLAWVSDMDELLEYRYGNQTTIGEAVEMQLSSRNTSLEDLCGISFASLGGMYPSAGYAQSARIGEKLIAVGRVPDSVSTYGKTLSNVRRVLRVGLHGVAYCENLPPIGATENTTRDSVDINDVNVFRPDIEDIRILHLMDSYNRRSAPWMVEGAKKENWSSYYVRDFSDLVQMELERRTLENRSEALRMNP
ncbi:hypothetical protein HJC23_002587 [Cyclotella cryptica]|uniref:Glycosyltransferase family 92 protein n=1 Tax=Cyclotella cryptica TaxID=29204 RepID=A0ABD3P4N6_9STRA|eukprot:CCRYP_017683-RA/>CCRYP_017683-RA protein AED:0.09 eAED:0.09 QI:0/-1/0/1/-1/1/1/0/608